MDKEKNMPFGKRVPIKLESVIATKVTASDLKKELNSIGLTCAHTEEQQLEKYIQEVVSTFKGGVNQGFGTYKFRDTNTMNAQTDFSLIKDWKTFREAIVIDLDIDNQWIINDSAGQYTVDLCTIGHSTGFDYLRDNYSGFPGNYGTKEYDQKEPTVESIKTTFLALSTSLASALVEGIDEVTLESFMAHLIEGMPKEVVDYEQNEERYMYIVNDYDSVSGDCKGIGIISMEFSIIIKNYKDKKDTYQNCHFDLKMRTIFHTDADELHAEAEFVRMGLKKNLFRCSQIPFSPEVKVFDEFPIACEETFNYSLLLESKDKLMAALVLYTPDIENIGILDNADSSATSQYSKTITSGFTFSIAEKIGADISCEIGCEFAKMGVTLSMEMSMTEQWNESQSETISFTVPGGQRAYLYQYYVHAAILYYDLETFKFYYGPSGRFLTNEVRTSKTSLTIK